MLDVRHEGKVERRNWEEMIDRWEGRSDSGNLLN